MKTFLTWICSFVITGVIISPFFWLRFLKQKSQWWYVIGSLLASFAFSMLYIFVIADFTTKLASNIGNNFYYLYDNASGNALPIIFFAILFSPFFLTRAVFKIFSAKWFLISLVMSLLIFVIYAIIFVYIIFPTAIGVIFKNLN
jgi:hypothetical protein